MGCEESFVWHSVDVRLEAVTSVPNTCHHLQRLEKTMEIKRVGRIGPGCSSAGKVLQRVVSWIGDGFIWEADPRLSGKLLKLVNVIERKGVTVPGAKDIGKDDLNVNSILECVEANIVQAAAGLEQYITLDRPDTAYSVKTALQQMSKPTKQMKLRVIKGPAFEGQSEVGLEVIGINSSRRALTCVWRMSVFIVALRNNDV